MDDVEQLIALARAQRGVFTTPQAAAFGFSWQGLACLVKQGRLRRLARSVYAIGPPPTSPEAAHEELCRGFLLVYPDAVLCGVSAVLAHELPVWGCDLSRARLERDVRRQVDRSGACVRPRDGDPVSSPWGPSVPLPAAVVGCCLDSSTAAGVVIADAALGRNALTMGELQAEVARRARHPFLQRARAMVELVDPRSESVGESRLRLVLTYLGIEVESQVEIWDGARVFARADFKVKRSNVLIEFDGKVKYGEGGSAALWAEKKREDRLRRKGLLVVRVIWVDLDHPQRIKRWIDEAEATVGRIAS